VTFLSLYGRVNIHNSYAGSLEFKALVLGSNLTRVLQMVYYHCNINESNCVSLALRLPRQSKI